MHHPPPSTADHAAPRPQCVGCGSWKSISLLKTGCPSCIIVGLVLLPFSAIVALVQKLRR